MYTRYIQYICAHTLLINLEMTKEFFSIQLTNLNIIVSLLLIHIKIARITESLFPIKHTYVWILLFLNLVFLSALLVQSKVTIV